MHNGAAVILLTLILAGGCEQSGEFNGRSKKDWIRDASDSASSVRFHAMNALGHLARNEADSGEVLRILRASLCDVDADVRMAVHTALISSVGQFGKGQRVGPECAQPQEAGRR